MKRGKIGAEGYAGPTQIGGKGKYESDKKWVTRAIYFPNNIPDAQFDENARKQIRDSLVTEGTIVPTNIQFEKVENIGTIPISGSATLKMKEDGYAEISGSVSVLNPVVTPLRKLEIMKLCRYCSSEIPADSRICPVCRKILE